MNVLDIQNKLLEFGIQKDVDSLWHVDKMDLLKMKDYSVFNNYCDVVIEGLTIGSKYRLLIDKHLPSECTAYLSDFMLVEDVF